MRSGTCRRLMITCRTAMALNVACRRPAGTVDDGVGALVVCEFFSARAGVLRPLEISITSDGSQRFQVQVVVHPLTMEMTSRLVAGRTASP